MTAGMEADASQPQSAYGFLTAVEQPGSGFYGGYLAISAQGRPLEFRLSTPVLPSRAQEILYGVSLRPYLLGELIAGTLLAEATLPVVAILTDLGEMGTIAEIRREPVFFVDESGVAVPASGAQPMTSGVPSAAAPDILASLARYVALREPFERIRAALQEAHAVAQDDHQHAESHAGTRAA